MGYIFVVCKPNAWLYFKQTNQMNKFFATIRNFYELGYKDIKKENFGGILLKPIFNVTALYHCSVEVNSTTALT